MIWLNEQPFKKPDEKTKIKAVNNIYKPTTAYKKAMIEALQITTAIAVLLFVGLICSWIGRQTKIPDVLLLLLAGIGFGHLTFKDVPLIDFPPTFLSSLAILALAMIVFDGTARLRLKELDTFSLKALKLISLFTLFILVAFALISHYLLGTDLWNSLLFASVMVGTGPEVLFALTQKIRAFTILKLESIFNTPLTVILPFLILDLSKNISNGAVAEIAEQLIPFIMALVVGIGSGVFVGIILFKIVQKVYAEVYSPLAVIIAALLSYVLAENLGGSGVLSVTALGVFFGNVYVKEKMTLLDIESVFAKTLHILIFMLAGVVIKIPLTKEFFITSGLLFAVYLAIRFVCVYLSFKEYTKAEIAIMTLCSPKGVATTAVVFILAVSGAPEIIIDMIFAFIIYSIALATFVAFIVSKYLTNHEDHTTRHKLPR